MNKSINVRGMTCEHCRASVTKAIQAVPGVRSVHVDLAGGKADWTGEADPERVRQAVRDIGFDAD